MPKGFSMMIRDLSTSPASASVRTGGRGGHAQVLESSGFAAQVVLGLADRRRQGDGAARLAHVGQLRVEGRPFVVGERVGELVAGGAGELAEPFVVDLFERGADDTALRQQAGLRQVEQAGEELATGQVTRGSEEDDDVRLQRGDEVWADVAGIGVVRHAAAS
jgi:hypothetical protein